jgi:hypothetical protein
MTFTIFVQAAAVFQLEQDGAAPAMRVMAVGSRLDPTQGLKVTFSRALARSAVAWMPQIAALNALSDRLRRGA